ncbi:hypothetical protein AHAS_Ahas18G0071400 [Arachis hypogaea]
MVATPGCPKKFKLRRDRIAEMLFSCKQTRVDCDRCLGGGDDDSAYKNSDFHHNWDDVLDDDIDDHGNMDMNKILSNYKLVKLRH